MFTACASVDQQRAEEEQVRGYSGGGWFEQVCQRQTFHFQPRSFLYWKKKISGAIRNVFIWDQKPLNNF